MNTDTIAKLHYDSIVEATRSFFAEAGAKTALIGVSGGLDSALVACIAADALGGENVYGISMPSRNSSDHSFDDAEDLMERLGANFRVISIEEYHKMFQTSLGLTGLANENVQARIRGLILMSVSNMEGQIVLATGNRSEILMGYCTMYGDTVGGFAPLANNYKTGVYSLARYRNTLADAPIPENTILKPPSAELAPGQQDSDSLPEYEILDPILMAFSGGASRDTLAETFGAELVDGILQKIKRNVWKSKQLPPAPPLPNLN